MHKPSPKETVSRAFSATTRTKTRSTASQRTSSLAWFFLRREPYYHKLQYSKTPKFDVAAAVLGAIVSAFVGYLTLSSLGSAGADLTDMAIVFWYIFLTYRCLMLLVFLLRDSTNFFFNTPACFFRLLTTGGLLAKIRRWWATLLGHRS